MRPIKPVYILSVSSNSNLKIISMLFLTRVLLASLPQHLRIRVPRRHNDAALSVCALQYGPTYYIRMPEPNPHRLRQQNSRLPKQLCGNKQSLRHREATKVAFYCHSIDGQYIATAASYYILQNLLSRT
jgi:hypothetical protein